MFNLMKYEVLYRQSVKTFSVSLEHSNLPHLLKSDISFASLLLAVLAILFSWVLAIIVPVLVALLLTKLNVLMTWYSCPKFTLLLYGLPSLFGLLLGHFIANKLIKKVCYRGGPSLQPPIFYDRHSENVGNCRKMQENVD